MPARILTGEIGARWLTVVAERDLVSGTRHVWRSAVSSWWAEQTLSSAPSPMVEKVVELVLRGIDRQSLPAERAAKAAKTITTPVTPALLAAVRPFLDGISGPIGVMRWAAATVAVYALMRPSELLGSHVLADDRALSASAISFYEAGPEPQRFLCSGGALRLGVTPGSMRIDLGVTKADQRGTNPPVIIAAEPAVQAMWAWLQLRARNAWSLHRHLFGIPGDEPRLSAKALLEWLQPAVRRVQGDQRIRLSGKCFRQGGASALAAAGADAPDIAKAGHWASVRMFERYAGQAAAASRAAALSARMAPGASAASPTPAASSSR